MTVGFQAFFPNGYQAQIDDTYRNFHLRRSGTLYNGDFVTGSGAYSPERQAIISTAGMTRPVCVIRPLGDYNTIAAVSPVIGGFAINVWWNLDQSAGIEYYIFDEWTPPGDNFGLEIRNAAGSIVYHSSWYRMRVIGFRQLAASGTPSITYNADHDISDIAAVTPAAGVLLPYSRMASDAVSEGGSPGSPWPTGGMYVLREGLYFKSPAVLTTGFVSTGYSNGWWDVITGWWNKGGITILFVDLNGYPKNYNP